MVGITNVTRGNSVYTGGIEKGEFIARIFTQI